MTIRLGPIIIGIPGRDVPAYRTLAEVFAALGPPERGPGGEPMNLSAVTEDAWPELTRPVVVLRADFVRTMCNPRTTIALAKTGAR